MTGRVKSLIDFHATTSFGSQANLQLQHGKARSTYLALTVKQQHELARESIAQIDKGNDRFAEVLCCLACFRPGSLVSYQQALLERRQVRVLEEKLLPGIEYVGLDAKLITQVGNGSPFEEFYQDGLGFPLSSASKGDIAFFKMSGIVLALYPSDKLAEDAQVAPDGSGFRGVFPARR